MNINRGTEKEDVVHIYSGILLRQKKVPSVPSADMWKDLETVIHSEVSEKQKNKYCILRYL